MEKEEFLRKIRESNEMDMPFETDAIKSGWEIGALISGLVGILICFLEWLFLDRFNLSVMLPVVVSLTVANVIAAIRLRTVKRRVIALLLCLLTLVYTVLYILSFAYGWL